MNAKERFDSANELVERISSEPEFDAFFMRFYNQQKRTNAADRGG